MSPAPVDRASEFAERRARIEATDDPDRRAQMRFFAELDERTSMPADPALGRALAEFFELVTARSRERATAAWEGLPFARVALRDRPWNEAAARVEALLFESFCSPHLGWRENAAFPWSGFRAAFEAFVSGELHVLSTPTDEHGAPNGLSYLLFAESASYFAHRGPEPRAAFWTRAFEIFADTAEVLCWLYWSGAARTRDDYSFSFKGERTFTTDQWRARRRARRRLAYPALEPEERFSDLVAHAVVDEARNARSSDLPRTVVSRRLVHAVASGGRLGFRHVPNSNTHAPEGPR